MPITINGRTYSDEEVAEMARNAVYGPNPPLAIPSFPYPTGTIQDTLNREAGRTFPIEGGAQVNSPYGMRKHPILRRERMHTGVDFSRNPAGVRGSLTGKQVKSVKAGTVLASGYNPGFGNYVHVKHADGTITSYNHLQHKSRTVGKDDAVKAGQTLGRVGSTGLSEAPHLHFEYFANEKDYKAKRRSDPTPLVNSIRPAVALKTPGLVEQVARAATRPQIGAPVVPVTSQKIPAPQGPKWDTVRTMPLSVAANPRIARAPTDISTVTNPIPRQLQPTAANGVLPPPKAVPTTPFNRLDMREPALAGKFDSKPSVGRKDYRPTAKVAAAVPAKVIKPDTAQAIRTAAAVQPSPVRTPSVTPAKAKADMPKGPVMGYGNTNTVKDTTPKASKPENRPATQVQPTIAKRGPAKEVAVASKDAAGRIAGAFSQVPKETIPRSPATPVKPTAAKVVATAPAKQVSPAAAARAASSIVAASPAKLAPARSVTQVAAGTVPLAKAGAPLTRGIEIGYGNTSKATAPLPRAASPAPVFAKVAPKAVGKTNLAQTTVPIQGHVGPVSYSARAPNANAPSLVVSPAERSGVPPVLAATPTGRIKLGALPLSPPRPAVIPATAPAAIAPKTLTPRPVSGKMGNSTQKDAIGDIIAKPARPTPLPTAITPASFSGSNLPPGAPIRSLPTVGVKNTSALPTVPLNEMSTQSVKGIPMVTKGFNPAIPTGVPQKVVKAVETLANDPLVQQVLAPRPQVIGPPPIQPMGMPVAAPALRGSPIVPSGIFQGGSFAPGGYATIPGTSVGGGAFFQAPGKYTFKGGQPIDISRGGAWTTAPQISAARDAGKRSLAGSGTRKK